MNVYLVTFTADVAFGSQLKSEHEVVVTTSSQEDAEREAKKLFLEKGARTASYRAGEQRPGETPEIRNVRCSELGFIGVVNGKLIEKRLPFRTLTENLNPRRR